MNWVEGMAAAIAYIEDNLEGELKIEDIARKAYVSPFHFQRAFTMLCGMTVGEYIRRRRLSLAGSELTASDVKIIDLALKYGYDSPDSFTRAFTRFHGVTPAAVRKNGAPVKSFLPLRVIFKLEGGINMDYKIVEKEAFTVMGVTRRFITEAAHNEIPGFWDEHNASDKKALIKGMYGICIDDEADKGKFDYMIADNYLPWEELPEGVTCRVIPRRTWAVFPSRGPMPESLHEVIKRVFSEWLPNCRENALADNINIELYTPACDYPDGTKDKNYYCEFWIPVCKK